MNSSIYLKIKKFIEENRLLEYGDKIVAGVSGGADSVFLFTVLAKLAGEYGLGLCAVHVNHGIRGEEALRDEQYTVSLVEGLGYKCKVFRKDIKAMAAHLKLTEEEAGRRYRYECFENVRKELGYNKTAVAHHKDDQAETVLFQLIRGSGIRGLGGMKPENGSIIRPLLDIRRMEIEEALKAEGISYCTDTTNENNNYARNMLRNNIIPYIEDNIQPAVVERFVGTAKQLQDIYSYIRRQAAALYKEIVTHNNNIYMADAERLSEADIVIQREVLMCMAGKAAGSRKDITSKHIDMFTGLLAGSTGRRLNLPYGLCAGRDYNKIWIRKGKPEDGHIGNGKINICVPGSVELEYINGKKHIILFEKKHREEIPATIKKNNCTKWFDYDKIKFMPQFRYPENGDYMWLRTDGIRKKLSRILIDAKIPASERGRTWVLAEGSHILWIPAMGRCSAYYYVTDGTGNVLCANMSTEGEKE